MVDQKPGRGTITVYSRWNTRLGSSTTFPTLQVISFIQPFSFHEYPIRKTNYLTASYTICKGRISVGEAESHRDAARSLNLGNWNIGTLHISRDCSKNRVPQIGMEKISPPHATPFLRTPRVVYLLHWIGGRSCPVFGGGMAGIGVVEVEGRRRARDSGAVRIEYRVYLSMQGFSLFPRLVHPILSTDVFRFAGLYCHFSRLFKNPPVDLKTPRTLTPVRLNLAWKTSHLEYLYC